MIVNKEDLKKYSMIICYICAKPMEVGQSYEKITTHSKQKIVVHTDCICRKGVK